MKQKSFFEMSDAERFESAFGIKLHWWQRLHLRMLKAWTKRNRKMFMYRH